MKACFDAKYTLLKLCQQMLKYSIKMFTERHISRKLKFSVRFT